ncbi:hypothetical protein [Bacillus changyiensis]|uniref:hypothetical protein n=1 Tax=Bacillus changyiensis TaxID=3004103 RepID=UPI0022E1551C|nr:hypothetical protein [Bacillus changyiensis]MDA1478039.1 hypothetical protein [Bacillus changyiensis]
MLEVNLFNTPYLESELESIECLEGTEELVERMKEHVINNPKSTESFEVELSVVVDCFRKKIVAIFNYIEDEDQELEKYIECESVKEVDVVCLA